MSIVTFIPNSPIASGAVADLRDAVGWERHDEDYPTAMEDYWATISGFDFTGALVAW